MRPDTLPARRALLLAGLGLLGAGPGPVHADVDEWPTRTIRLLVAYPPGGVSDETARLLADHLATRLGVRVVVENRGGAGGSIAMETLAKAAPDGYTLCFSAITPLSLWPLLGHTHYDPVHDIAPVVSVMFTPVLVVGTSALHGHSLTHALAQSRDGRGSLRWATSGNGTTGHLVLEQVRRASGADITHIPYRGGARQLHDALGGQFEVLSSNVGPLQLRYVRSGQFKPLAVGAPSRLDVLAGVPTLEELGFPLANRVSLFGIFAPGRTRPTLLRRLNEEINAVIAQPDMQDRLSAVNNVPTGGSAQEFAGLIAQDTARNRALLETGLAAPR